MQIFVLIFLICSSVLAGMLSDWETITNMNEVYDIEFDDNIAWVATTGGIYSFNLSDSQITRYSNLDGLSSIDIRTLEIDDHGFIIAGGENGIIEMYLKNLDEWNQLTELIDNSISDILYRNDTLWVAAGKGVAVFPWNGSDYKFKDYYKNFDILPNQVSKIELFANRIWLGTDRGLFCAPADIKKYTINDPALWDIFTINNGLTNNNILELAVIDNTLWIGTSAGLVTINEQLAVTVENAWGTTSQDGANAIVKSGVDIFIGSPTDRSYYKFIRNSEKILQANFRTNIHCLQSQSGENIWVGLNGDGIYRSDNSKHLKLDGPGVSAVRYVIKDSNKNIWASSGKFKLTPNKGFSIYNGKYWSSFDFQGHGWFHLGNTVSVLEDPYQNIWLSTWGAGLMVQRHGEFEYFHNYTNTGIIVLDNIISYDEIEIPAIDGEYTNFFTGWEGDLEYEVISALNIDNYGRLWVANYIAANDNYIAIAPFTNDGFVSLDKERWTYISNSAFPEIGDGEISCIAFDDFYRAYVGTFRHGVYKIDYQDQNSISFVERFTTSDNLYGNRILSIEKDYDGIMWIGTSAGLNSYDGVNLYRHVGDPTGQSGPLDNQINQIIVDNANNKWFATTGGLSILRGERSPWDSTAWIGFNKENSGLVDNNVNTVFVDSDKSEALIGTENGLSIYRGSFAEIQEKFDKMVGGPNPFLINNSENKFLIRNLLYNSEVKIFTLNGQLIQKLNTDNNAVDGGRAEWDGRDLNGKLVASGIYLYFAYSENGKSKAGKIAVVRE